MGGSGSRQQSGGVGRRWGKGQKQAKTGKNRSKYGVFAGSGKGPFLGKKGGFWDQNRGCGVKIGGIGEHLRGDEEAGKRGDGYLRQNRGILGKKKGIFGGKNGGIWGQPGGIW